MKFLKNKECLFSLFLATILVLGIAYVSAEKPYHDGSDMISLSELSEADIDQMAAVLAEMKSAREDMK